MLNRQNGHSQSQQITLGKLTTLNSLQSGFVLVEKDMGYKKCNSQVQWRTTWGENRTETVHPAQPSCNIQLIALKTGHENKNKSKIELLKNTYFDSNPQGEANTNTELPVYYVILKGEKKHTQQKQQRKNKFTYWRKAYICPALSAAPLSTWSQLMSEEGCSPQQEWGPLDVDSSVQRSGCSWAERMSGWWAISMWWKCGNPFITTNFIVFTPHYHAWHCIWCKCSNDVTL